MTEPTKEVEYRDQLVEGLRALADFIQQHPALPVSRHDHNAAVEYCVLATEEAAGVAEVEAIADVLGVPTTDNGHNIEVRRQFAGTCYRAFYVHREVYADHRVEQQHLQEWNKAGRPPVAELVDPGQPEDAAAVDELSSGAAETILDFLSGPMEVCQFETCVRPVGHTGYHKNRHGVVIGEQPEEEHDERACAEQNGDCACLSAGGAS